MEKNNEYLELIRNNFLAYCLYIFPGFKTPPHVVKICEEIDKVVNGDILRLMISIPPRNGKSTLCSCLLPSYLIGRDPTNKIIGATYGYDLSRTFSKQVLEIVSRPEYKLIFPETNFDNTGKSASIWYTDKMGFYKCTSRSGSLTGFSSNFSIIDDTIKSSVEASSSSMLDSIYSWFFSTMYSRLTNKPNGEKAKVIILSTRWAKRDLIGRILDSDTTGEWKYINYPALNEREEPLWPEVQSKELLLSIKRSDPKTFQCLYQGAPGEDVAAEFNISNFLIYPISHEFHKSPKFYFSSWDTAAKIGEDNDFTVGALFSLHQNKIYLEEYVRGKYEFPELERLIKEKNKEWNARYCLVESASSGIGILQTLKVSHKDVKYYGIPADVKKKLPVVIPRLEDHSVVLKNYEEIISELKDYPSGEHDDCVSSIVNAVWYYSLNWRRETEISLPPKTVIKERKIRKVI